MQHLSPVGCRLSCRVASHRIARRWLGLVRHLAACLLLLAALGPAHAQTTTSQPSLPAVPTPTELGPLARPGGSANPDTAALRRHLRQAASLQTGYHDSAALAEYQAALKINPQEYESLWRAAVLSVRIGNRYTDETRKAAYFGEARRYAEQALALAPTAGESNYALALALFSQAGLLNARDRLRLFKELQNPVMLAAARRPDLPEAWQLLGRWHYRVAHYNALEKLFSRVFLGGAPRSASTDQAIAALEKARALAPERIQYTYDLARIYKYQGHHRRYAIALLQRAVRQPTYTSEDLIMNRLCEQLLAPMQRAATRRDRRHARWYQHLRARPRLVPLAAPATLGPPAP
ncbi:hypothetical protein HHL22_06285 [Hymenobacter sp. RP-2-7]|uniref:Tetratricopeptide repeat protein n=1 Tax=Hymenobacter polaris TaxID=2682546 RepID=A0A7Y0ACG4_9BACT|nr:hypothetical protein [Hymenobacter polaris]NML64809.1 hypothetical protein [Hymenobacter polaris]